MRIAVESWAPEYGAPVEESAVGAATAEVAVDVEASAADWAPRTPPGGSERPAMIGFVDGVRRVDARVWVTGEDGIARPGLCATWAAGAVRCTDDPSVAVIERAEVRRGLFSSVPVPEPFATRHGTYRLVPVTADDPDQLSLALQGCMADLEHVVSVRDADGDAADLLILDGPLRDRHRLPGAVGYVKTHHTAYLPESVQGVVPSLACGQRTPLFQIGGRWSRWSWYLRLPVEISHGWAGVVRCEASVEVPLADAVVLADLVTSVLPRFASEPQKDPRAPHNLYPIAGLERALRRRLGDPSLLFRSLREAAVRVA